MSNPKTTILTVTDAQIREMLAEAEKPVDSARVALCLSALRGNADARAECARVISKAASIEPAAQEIADAVLKGRSSAKWRPNSTYRSAYAAAYAMVGNNYSCELRHRASEIVAAALVESGEEAATLTDALANYTKKIDVGDARVERRREWQADVVVDTNIGDVYLTVGVPDSEIGTAQACGSDHGMVDVWPQGDSPDAWCPEPDAGKERYEEIVGACRRAAIRAYRSSDEPNGPTLRPDADTSHDDAQDMYAAYGWHLSTEKAGDVELQAVDYASLDEGDDVALRRLRDSNCDPDLTRDEAIQIVNRAREVRDAMDAVEEHLQRAVTAYDTRDLAAVIEALDEAGRLEREHGDDPATSALRKQLIAEES